MSKKIINMLCFIVLTIISAKVQASLLSCKNPQGKNICAGLGQEDLAGNVQDLNWCKNNVVHSVNNALTNYLFSSLKNTFAAPLDKAAVDQLYETLKCVREFVQTYGKADKDLNNALSAISELINTLLNTTKIVYTTSFSKAGIVSNKTNLGLFTEDFSTIIKQATTKRLQLEKVYFFYSDKKTTRDLLVKIFGIIEECAKKASQDIDKEAAKRQK